jgi:hypothetical protein
MARNQTIVQDSLGNASVSNNFTAANLIRSGGTASQFLKADGSVDSNAYVTVTTARSALSFVAGSGAYNSSTGVITIPTNTNQLTNGAGFITGYTETDTLDSVLSRGTSSTRLISLTSATSTTGIAIQSSSAANGGSVLRFTKAAAANQVYITLESDQLYFGVPANNTTNADVGTKGSVNLRLQTNYTTRINIDPTGTIQLLPLTSNGFLKTSGSNGTLVVDTNTYLTSYTETDTLNSVTGRGATTSNTIQIGKLGIGRAAGSNESISVENPEGFWLIQGFRSGSSVGGLHTNSGVLHVQAADVRIQASSTATWNGDTLATRPWVTSQGYITGYTETDTLASVTGRGSSTSTTLNLDGRINIGNGLTRPSALNSDSVAHARIGGSDVHLYVASLGAAGGYKVAVQAARTSDFQSFDLDLQSNGGILRYGGNEIATRTWVTSQNYLTSIPAHNQAWSTITSTPTTIGGYGISDAVYTTTSDFTTAGSGWYRVATTAGDGRGYYYVELFCTGGNHNPAYLRIEAMGDWGNDKLIAAYTDLGFPASAVRITRSSTTTFIEVNFTTTIFGASARVVRLGFNSGVSVLSGALSAGGNTVQETLSVTSKINAASISIAGNIVLHAGNYNSYSPTLTGGGASGTWGISITGNAATLGGYSPNQTGGAYTIVQRDANGYIQNSYFYMSGGGSERNSSGLGYIAGFNSSDYYVRSYNSTAVASFLGLGTMAYASTSSYVPYGNWGTTSGLNDYKLYLRTNGDNNHYLWNASDDWEELNAYEGTGFRITSVGGSVGVLYVYGSSNGGYTYSPYSFRAPIFYDSQDTGYYVDPNSTSELRNLYLGAHDSGTSEFLFGENSSGWYGMRWYWDSGVNFYWYGRNAGTDTLIMNYTTNDNSYAKWHRHFHMNSYNIDYVGTIYMNGGVYIQTQNNRSLQVTSSGGADNGIYGRGSSGQFAYQLYGNGSGSYGFLDGPWAAWDLRKAVDGALYMNDNDNYYIYTNSTGTSLSIAGKITTAVSNGTIISHASMTDAFGYNNSYGTYIGSVVGGTYYIYANGSFYDNGTIRSFIHSGNIGSQSVSYATSAGSVNQANVAYLVNGTSGGAIQTWDVRTISPSTMTSYRMGFGFTSWANNNSAPYADYLHLRSYGDGSGGSDNLVTFLKSGFGMRIWQQSFGSTSPYSSYVDVIHSGNIGSQSVSNSSSLGGYGSGTYIGKFGSGNGYYQVDNWIQFNTSAGMFWPNYNGAHIYPNTSTSYGSVRIDGTRNGWRGLNFAGSVTLMMNDNETGHYKDGYGWQWRWYQGTMFVSRSTYGGGTEYTVVDTGNISSYTAGNANSISAAVGGSYTWTNTNYFRSNLGGYCGSLSNPPLQVYSDSNNSAFFSFHKGGHYAVNMGLDADNVIRIGGWSMSANRFQMDASGNLTMSGDITAYSDARIKENVVTVEDAIDRVQKMRGVFYNRTDSDDKKRKVGVIAQEMMEVLPEVVNQDNDGMYNVSYGNIVGVLIEAIKEQQLQIEKLQNKLDNVLSSR